MKKLLLLAGILVVGATSFAFPWPDKEHFQDNESYSNEIQVSANVVKDLTVTATDVEFGNVAAGMKNVQPKKNGEITIVAEKGSRVQVKLCYLDGNELEKDGSIELKRRGLSGDANLEGETLVYKPNFVATTVAMDSEEKIIPITGRLTVPDIAHFGKYSANIKVKAKYTSFGD